MPIGREYDLESDRPRHGLVLVDKPAGPTSHDIVEVMRHALGTRRIGHMGTLDPLATGLLLIGVGEGTKLTQFLSEMDKRYECVARLGARSATYDAMGEIEPAGDPSGLTRDRIESALQPFRGWIEQAPPPYSAVKVQGRRLYDYARKGEAVESKPRRVRVFDLELTRLELPELELRMRVSSGTYVRSIVHDLGVSLGVGAYVTQLRRAAVGPFDVRDALRIGSGGALEGDGPRARRTLAQALGHWRQPRIPEPLLDALRNGLALSAKDLQYGQPELISDHLYALVDSADHLVAIARCIVSRGDIKCAIPNSVRSSEAPTEEGTSYKIGNAVRGDLVLKPIRIFHDE